MQPCSERAAEQALHPHISGETPGQCSCEASWAFCPPVIDSCTRPGGSAPWRWRWGMQARAGCASEGCRCRCCCRCCSLPHRSLSRSTSPSSRSRHCSSCSASSAGSTGLLRPAPRHHFVVGQAAAKDVQGRADADVYAALAQAGHPLDVSHVPHAACRQGSKVEWARSGRAGEQGRVGGQGSGSRREVAGKPKQSGNRWYQLRCSPAAGTIAVLPLVSAALLTCVGDGDGRVRAQQRHKLILQTGRQSSGG